MPASICAPGTSQPIPGKATSFYLTGGALALLAQALELGWLAEVIAYVSGINFVLTDICNTDPPPDPGLTAADVACLFSFNPLCDTGAVITKVTQLIEHLAWYQWCECVGTTTPSAPAAPGAPTGLVGVNPPSIIASGPAVTCSDLKALSLGPSPATGFITTNDPLPGINQSVTGAFGIFKATPVNKPTFAQLKITDHADGANSTANSYQWSAYDSSGGFISTFIQMNVGASPGVPQTFTSSLTAVPASTAYWRITVSPFGSGTPTNHFDIEAILECPTQSGGANTLGCCPPPADISSLVSDVKTLVTTIQRYLLPFAYINGATHSGLSGSGSFAVSRLLGVKIHLSTIPSSVGVETATPNRLFDAGWISCMDGNGVILETRVTAIDQVWIPRLFPEALTFGYSFAPGVNANVTELEAEP